MNVPVRAVAAALLLLLGVAGVAAASPPPPPPPPACGICDGPPAPPTVVPTLAPTAIAVQAAVNVHLDTPKVARGHMAKLAVDASTDDSVTINVVYHRFKAKTIHSRVGSSGSLTKTWRVPGSAPTGKADVKVVVDDSAGRTTRTVHFEVLP